MATQHDVYNACVQSFVDHSYGTALTLADNLIHEGTLFPIHMILLLSALHLGRTDLVTKHGERLLAAAAGLPWEATLVRLVLGRVSAAKALSQANTNDRCCQAHYYSGALALTAGDEDRARTSFQASVSFLSNCVEHIITEIELKQLTGTARDQDGSGNRLHRSTNDRPWDLAALLDKLSREHKPHFVYRGQAQQYGALLPSGYRPLVDLTQPQVLAEPAGRDSDSQSVCRVKAHVLGRDGSRWIEGESLYGRGRVFRAILTNSLWPEAGKRRIDFVSLCRAQVGYLLSQLFCQHCCLPTEGLDVTEQVDVAALFAIFDYSRNAYVDESSPCGVIFRIDVGERRPISMKQLKAIDFYSCPFFVSGVEVLDLLGHCPTEHDSLCSLATYFREKQLLEMSDMSWDELRRRRPLELLKLPDGGIESGRVKMQYAGLIFPDVLLPRWYETTSAPPPQGKTWDGPQCIEDLANNQAVETFLFRHDVENRTRIAHNPEQIFPAADPLRSLLSKFVMAMSGGSGAIPIVVQDASVFSMGEDEELPR